MSEAIKRTEVLHATCVTIGTTAALIVGPSGSGKSGLALQLMALGATLVADDRTEITPTEFGLCARCPDAIRGRIEARGVGILAADSAASTYLRCVIDMGQQEAERLPPIRHIQIAGQSLPLLHNVVAPHFPAAILQYLKGARSD